MCLYRHIKLVRRRLYWVMRNPHVTRFLEIHLLIVHELFMNFRTIFNGTIKILHAFRSILYRRDNTLKEIEMIEN